MKGLHCDTAGSLCCDDREIRTISHLCSQYYTLAHAVDNCNPGIARTTCDVAVAASSRMIHLPTRICLLLFKFATTKVICSFCSLCLAWYLAPQIRSMNNRFHSEAKLPWSNDYPLANHISTNKSSANLEMPLFSRLYPSFGYLRKIFPPRGFKILPIKWSSQ